VSSDDNHAAVLQVRALFCGLRCYSSIAAAAASDAAVYSKFAD